MKKYLLMALCLVVIHHVFAQRTKYNFNSSWKVLVGDATGAETNAFNDVAWKPVTLPYAWNEDEAFKKDIADLSTGIAWYRKHFKIPASQKGQKIFLEFEGIRQAGEFYLNGKYIGLHENGITAFGFDISDAVRFGNEENILAVKINNSWNYKEKATSSGFQWSDKNFNANYGGIPKNVYLHVMGRIYQTLPLFTTLATTGVYIYANDFDIAKKSATVHTSSQIKNETGTAQTIQYEVVITDAQTNKPAQTILGEKITINAGDTKTVNAAATVNNLNFWSWGYGYLYNVQTILKINNHVVDIVHTKTGFRKTEFKNGMIYLNDRVIQVHGYAQRTSNEWPAIGMSVPAWLSDYSNKLMVESNGNLVRWMHITPWKQDVESCDRVGLMQAMPAGDAEKDVEGRRWEQRKEVMRDAIIYNRNNPSIIFYECGNESISEAHMSEMKAIKLMYDPNGGRAIGSREMLDSKVAEYGGEMLYINKSEHIPMWAMEYSRDEGLRKYWDEYTPPYHKDGEGPLYKGQSAAEYNRNQDSHAKENIARWYEYWKERPGTGSRVSSGGVNIIFSESNTHHRGAENYRRSGEVDAMRILKENYFTHQIMWNGWVDVEQPDIYIIGHWNYTENIQKDIYVVSSADKVELFINGVSAGFGEQSNRFLYTFKNIAWKPGTITARGYDANGKIICSAKKTTAGQPVGVRLKAMTSARGLIANGQDLALVEVEVVDANGNRCPTALNMINFTLDGPAEWRGGIAQGPDNYILSKKIPVECGVNRVLIRAGTTAGDIKITASSDALKSAAITLHSIAFATENGLSKILPSDGLATNLNRGPTPATPSFKTLRTAFNIVKATAGANTDSVYKSYDDNELSDWYNDGKLSTAWVQYELDRTGMVSEVAMKLNNFRTRTYPIKIWVDDKLVFNDTTQRSLGYFTAVFSPAKGRKVKIELTGAGNNNVTDAVEVNGKKLDDGVNRDDSRNKGTLSIIEVEVYERLK